MIQARVSLDGEAFTVRIDDESPERDGDGWACYPLAIRHESSGMERTEMTADSTEPDLVFIQYGFAEDLYEFYRRLFGRPAKADSFEVIPT